MCIYCIAIFLNDSILEKTFTIHVSDFRTVAPHSSYQAVIFVDGVHVDSKCRVAGEQIKVTAVHTSGNKMAPLVFSPFKTSGA